MTDQVTRWRARATALRARDNLNAQRIELGGQMSPIWLGRAPASRLTSGRVVMRVKAFGRAPIVLARAQMEPSSSGWRRARGQFHARQTRSANGRADTRINSLGLAGGRRRARRVKWAAARVRIRRAVAGRRPAGARPNRAKRRLSAAVSGHAPRPGWSGGRACSRARPFAGRPARLMGARPWAKIINWPRYLSAGRTVALE